MRSVTSFCPGSSGPTAGLRRGHQDRQVSTVLRTQPRPPLRCYLYPPLVIPNIFPHLSPCLQPGSGSRNKYTSLKINQGWQGARKEKKRNATAGLSPVNPAGLGSACIAKQDRTLRPMLTACECILALDWKAQAKVT